MQVISLSRTIADYLGVTEQQVIEMADRAVSSYRRYVVPKPKGGYRILFHPSATTKGLQYALLKTILSGLPVHAAASAYLLCRKSPLRKSADLHRRYRYSMRIDMRNFFPSIRPNDLISRIEKNRRIDDRDKMFLTKALFMRYRNGHIGLPVGAPSSPSISNAVLLDLDDALSRLANAEKSCYTRYADDIAYSTDTKGGCKEFYQSVKRLLAKTKSPRLAINYKKTLYMSRGTRRVVTGLTIACDGRVSIGRAKKRRVRNLVHRFTRGSLTEKEIRYLSGYLAFVNDVDSDFLDRLSIRFGEEKIRGLVFGNR